LKNILKEFGIRYTTLDEWIYKYETEGIDGLKESRSWKQYSKELKIRPSKITYPVNILKKSVVENMIFLVHRFYDVG